MVPLETVMKTCAAPNPTANACLTQGKALAQYLAMLGGMNVGLLVLNQTISGPVMAQMVMPTEVEPACPVDVWFYLQLKYNFTDPNPESLDGYHCVNAVLNMIRNYGLYSGTQQIYQECNLTCPAEFATMEKAYEASGLKAAIDMPVKAVPPSGDTNPIPGQPI
jgi:hypothetical protein